MQAYVHFDAVNANNLAMAGCNDVHLPVSTTAMQQWVEVCWHQIVGRVLQYVQVLWRAVTKSSIVHLSQRRLLYHISVLLGY